MKKQLLLASFAAFAVAATGIAAEGDGKGAKKAQMTPEKRAESMIKSLDKDADGKLDQAELAAAPVRPPKPDAPAPAKPAPAPEERAAMMIKRGDKDGDSKLDQTELAAVLQAPKKKPAA